MSRQQEIKKWLQRRELDDEDAFALQQAVETESLVCMFEAERLEEGLCVVSFRAPADPILLAGADEAALLHLLDIGCYSTLDTRLEPQQLPAKILRLH